MTPLSRPRPVRIGLFSELDGETSASEYRGTLYPKQGAFYVRYEETAEDRGRCFVTVKWNAGGLAIVRHGETEGEQSFRPGFRTAGWLRTGAGRLRLEMETAELSIAPEAADRLPIEIAWRYELWMNEQWAGRLNLRLVVQEENEE